VARVPGPLHVGGRGLTGVYVPGSRISTNGRDRSSTYSARIVLVRHGHADAKAGWSGDDGLRSLDSIGHQQAIGLVDVLVPVGPGRVLSSPYVRCQQTVEPVAMKLGLIIESSFALVPDAGLKALGMIRELSSVPTLIIPLLCTHGELMGSLLSELASQDDVNLSHKPPGMKGCAWILDFLGQRMLQPVTSHHVPHIVPVADPVTGIGASGELNHMSRTGKAEVFDDRVTALLARAYQLAESHLKGIDEAAEELAKMSGEDLTVISQARRVVLERMAAGSDRATKQVLSLIRRAIELGGWRWRWEDTGPVP
jgi:phosphohistidine phosphatase SixA